MYHTLNFKSHEKAERFFQYALNSRYIGVLSGMRYNPVTKNWFFALKVFD